MAKISTMVTDGIRFTQWSSYLSRCATEQRRQRDLWPAFSPGVIFYL